MRQMSNIFSKIDLVAMPTCGMTAPPVGTGDQSLGESDIVAGGRVARYSFLANLCGFPAMNVPAGMGECRQHI
jgi:Asp-tRNA(Asn)/Glu-tRNA(Gln) amidotransferase A subunit family amidase